jgi:hypothetical protein
MRDLVLYTGVLIFSILLVGIAAQLPRSPKSSSGTREPLKPRYLELKSVRATTLEEPPTMYQMRTAAPSKPTKFNVEERKMRSRLTTIDTQCAKIDAILQRLERPEEDKAHEKSSKVR